MENKTKQANVKEAKKSLQECLEPKRFRKIEILANSSAQPFSFIYAKSNLHFLAFYSKNTLNNLLMTWFID